MMYDEFMKNFLLGDLSVLMAVRHIFGIQSPKTSDSSFVDMMYVEFMKNFLLADSNASSWLLDSFWHPDSKNKVIPTL